MLKRKTRCLRQTATDRVEAVIPKMFDPDEMTMTDVEFQLEEGPNLRAHKFILSLSPVLKAALNNIDVRICPIPVISLQGFHRESVQNLLHFLYKGVVDMVWGSEIHTDFMKLCKALRVNPRSVRRTWGTSQESNVTSGNEADDVEANAEAATNGEVAPNVDDYEQIVEDDDEEARSNTTPDMDLAEKTDVQDKEVVEGESSNGDAMADEDAVENDISDKTNEANENIETVVHVNKVHEEEKGVKSGDQIDHEDNIREENNNLALDLVNIDELGLDTSSDNATEEKQFNYDSVSNDEPDGANVIDALKEPVIEGDVFGVKVDIENYNVITEEKSGSSDERTQEMIGAGDKLEVFEKESIIDVSRDLLEGVKDATTEIVKSKPERYVCDICVEVFSACRDLEEHKQTVHLIDEISDDDTQEETTEAIFDFLSKDLGITSLEMKKTETNQNVPENSKEVATTTTDQDLAIRIENVTSLEKDKLDEPFSLNEMNGATVKDEIPESNYESDPFEFKMPDSFDLSVDYIKEIVPFNASNKVEYIGSDDENEDAIGFIGLNKIEFKMPLTDLSSEIREELDNQPVPDENPSEDLNVIPVESSSSRHRNETPDSVEAITYKKDKSSKSSMRSREKPLQSKRDRKKKDRKLMNSLFGSDEVVSEGSSNNKKERHSSPSKESWPAKKERKESKSSNKERVVDEERKMMTPSPEDRPSSPTRTPTPTMSISEELKEKRERMMRKMKCDNEEKLDEKLELRDYKEKKRRRKKESSPRKRSSGTPQKASHHKGCNSSCRIDHRWSDDESWLVPDDYESSSESEALSDQEVKVEKREESKSRNKTKVKPVEEVKREDSTDDDDFIDDEDEDEEDEEAKRNRKKRLAERKKKAGGDVLFWMNPGHKSKVRVSVQMFAKEDIMDMNYYKMKLLADEGSDTDVEVKKVSDSDVSSEVSSKRSKSPDFVKRMLDSDTDNSQVKRKKHKKKRKKKKRHSSNGTPNSTEKYKRPVSDSSDEDVKPKSKLPKYHRSVSHVSSFGESSKRSNNFTKPVIQRSFSTLESLGISHNYGLSGEAKSVSSMPKIPKIVKPSTEMPKIPKIEKSTTEMPKIPKFAKIPKIL